jgi:SAM-dependent methyltransferase
MTSIKSFDRVAHCYDETRGIPDDAARQIGEGIVAIVRDVSGAPTALECGIGTGRIAVPLAEAGVRVTGVDISPKMLAVLREKRNDIDVMLAEASRPPLRDASFDALLFVHILHLVPDAEGTLRATLPLVRPGGVVVHGGDGQSAGRRREADAIIQRAVQDIAGVDIGNDRAHDRARDLFARLLTEAGATLDEITLARWNGRGRGRTMLDRLARKDYSSSWLIPDEALPRVLERVTPELEALYGGLDREFEWGRAFGVTIARLPG